MFQQTLDGASREWFGRLLNGCIDSWTDMLERFMERFALRKNCFKDPTEIFKMVQRANKTLSAFKGHWTEETIYILDVLVVMQVSAFLSNSRCLELARRFFDRDPQTVKEIMKRVDDFVKSKEAF
ncbi:reverse transcriptase domain-containing protein [Tanacetum coccineum]